jgi:purine nucleosidase
MEPDIRRRVIIDTDAKNEADDQFAIVHGLLSPSLEVRGLIAAHFGTSRSDRSMEESREEIDLLLDLMGLAQQVTVANGAPTAIPDEQTPRESEGAQLIIAESKLATPQEPLFVAFLGLLTDMASAILLDPDIVHRDIVVIWIGGVGYGGVETYPGVEFNLRNDIAAAGSGHPIRVVESVDVRFLLEDMFAKIRKFGREA